MLEQLTKKFAPHEHKQRKQGGRVLTYVAIDAVINRLNQVAGMNWTTDLNNGQVHYHGQDEKDREVWVASVAITLSVDLASRVGVGAAKGLDPDDVYKTALAEAIKKAANQFGIGLYLWDEEIRTEIEEAMTHPKEEEVPIEDSTLESLKEEVWLLFSQQNRQPPSNRDEIAAWAQVEEGELDDTNVLRGIISTRSQFPRTVYTD